MIGAAKDKQTIMDSLIIIFGYGSLINIESLKATAPSAKDIRPAFVKGFQREFCLWDPIGWTETNLDVAGQPMCSVDVHHAQDREARVNGIVFSVSDSDLEQLLIREQNYELIQTVFYDFESNQEQGMCRVFSANKRNGTYDYQNAAQARYLQICLDSAKEYGERFYKEFLRTTFIDGKSLNEMPELLARF